MLFGKGFKGCPKVAKPAGRCLTYRDEDTPHSGNAERIPGDLPSRGDVWNGLVGRDRSSRPAYLLGEGAPVHRAVFRGAAISRRQYHPVYRQKIATPLFIPFSKRLAMTGLMYYDDNYGACPFRGYFQALFIHPPENNPAYRSFNPSQKPRVTAHIFPNSRRTSRLIIFPAYARARASGQ